MTSPPRTPNKLTKKSKIPRLSPRRASGTQDTQASPQSPSRPDRRASQPSTPTPSTPVRADEGAVLGTQSSLPTNTSRKTAPEVRQSAAQENVLPSEPRSEQHADAQTTTTTTHDFAQQRPSIRHAQTAFRTPPRRSSLYPRTPTNTSRRPTVDLDPLAADHPAQHMPRRPTIEVDPAMGEDVFSQHPPRRSSLHPLASTTQTRRPTIDVDPAAPEDRSLHPPPLHPHHPLRRSSLHPRASLTGARRPTIDVDPLEEKEATGVPARTYLREDDGRPQPTRTKTDGHFRHVSFAGVSRGEGDASALEPPIAEDDVTALPSVDDASAGRPQWPSRFKHFRSASYTPRASPRRSVSAGPGPSPDRPSPARSKSLFTGSPSPKRPSVFARSNSLRSVRSMSRSMSVDIRRNFSSRRSISASSVLYYIGKAPLQNDLPFLDDDAHPDEVKEFMDMAQLKTESYKPSGPRKMAFKVFWFTLLTCIIYFAFVGFPLWNGIVYSLYWFLSTIDPISCGFVIFFCWGLIFAWVPLIFTQFEKTAEIEDVEKRDASECCLVIPAYKAAGALGETIEHAQKIFKPEQIFIIANGNSPTPLDNTEEVCNKYGVNHVWVPVGSKITAEFVGCLMAKDYKYIMLIDDDVHLPPNLPLVTERLDDMTKCIGYTIKSTGPNGSKGTLIQQAQDLEYKMSGLSRCFQAKVGTAIFPHGAIILWDRKVLEKLFWGHPGFQISEDWYFGHTARSSGYRIGFCSQVFVETETPPSLFIPVKSTRGGYGEMTIWKQRFFRWNFFYIYRLRDDLHYLFFAWRLGRYEVIAKLYLIYEIYSTITYTIRPILMPIAFVVQPRLTAIMMASLIGVYVVGVTFFNLNQLRRKKEMIAWKVIPVYFAMKLALMFVNTASVFYALYSYADFFSVRHPRVIENFKALDAAKMCVEKAREKRKERLQVARELLETLETLGEEQGEDATLPTAAVARVLEVEPERLERFAEEHEQEQEMDAALGGKKSQEERLTGGVRSPGRPRLERGQSRNSIFKEELGEPDGQDVTHSDRNENGSLGSSGRSMESISEGSVVGGGDPFGLQVKFTGSGSGGSSGSNRSGHTLADAVSTKSQASEKSTGQISGSTIGTELEDLPKVRVREPSIVHHPQPFKYPPPSKWNNSPAASPGPSRPASRTSIMTASSLNSVDDRSYLL